MVGLHNLYWYYGAQRIKMVLNEKTVYVHAAEAFQGLVNCQTNIFKELGTFTVVFRPNLYRNNGQNGWFAGEINSVLKPVHVTTS